jgi:hypothetical protein
MVSMEQTTPLALGSEDPATSTNKLKACGTFNFSLAVSVIKRQ